MIWNKLSTRKILDLMKPVLKKQDKYESGREYEGLNLNIFEENIYHCGWDEISYRMYSEFRPFNIYWKNIGYELMKYLIKHGPKVDREYIRSQLDDDYKPGPRDLDELLFEENGTLDAPKNKRKGNKNGK